MRQCAGIAGQLPDTRGFSTEHDAHNQPDCARPSGVVSSRTRDSTAVGACLTVSLWDASTSVTAFVNSLLKIVLNEDRAVDFSSPPRLNASMAIEIEPKTIEQDIAALTKEFALPPTTAQSLLWNEIHLLEHAARVRDFIPLLALKNVKERLRDQSFSDLPYGFA